MNVLPAFISHSSGRSRPTWTPPDPSFNAMVPAVNEVVIDDGYDDSPVYSGLPTNYNKWPRPVALSDGSIVSFFIKSHNHAAKGYAEMSIWRGTTWSNRRITIDGEIAVTVEISAQIIDGRIHIGIQDNPANPANYWEDYDRIQMAYIDEADLIADFDNCTFTSAGTTMFTYGGPEPGYAYVVSPFGRVQKVGAELWQPLYKFLQDFGASYPYPVYETQATYLKSTDNGVTWEEASVPILVQTGGTFPDGFTSEIGIVQLEGYGIVCILRNEEYGFYTHVRSDDNGATWEMDTAQLFYGFGSASGERRPVSVRVWHGTVYIVCGNRNLDIDNSTPLYHIEVITCTPEVLWDNRGYTGGDFTPTSELMDYEVNAKLYSSGIHWGYTDLFERYYPEAGIDELLVHGYDSSVLNTEPDEVRTIIFQYIIANNNTYPDPL